MVRRPAAVLNGARARATLAVAAPLVALAYFLAAPALPALSAGDAALVVAGAAGLLAIALSTLALLPAHATLIGPLLVLLGSGLLVGALNAGGVGAGANVCEALLAGAGGLLLARWLDRPPLAVALPLLVAAIDVWSVASGPSSTLLAGGTESVDALSFALPAWGRAGSVGHLGLPDAVFLSMFAAWAWRFGLRRAATLAAMTLGLLATLVLGVAFERAIPALPLLAGGYVLPNIDRIGRLLRDPTPAR